MRKTGIISPKNINVHIYCQFLGMLKKFRKSTIGFIMSICPFALNSLAPTGQRKLAF